MARNNLFSQVYDALMEENLEAKISKVRQLMDAWDEDPQAFDFSPTEVLPIADPGRPPLPQLVAPKDLPRRRLGSQKGHAALVHSIAHIEFNATNLALDAVYRFQTMPRAFFHDWLLVAGEEIYHFQLVRERLWQLGFDYGDFPGHNGLWESTYITAHDPLVRMALVPRTLEARGLDVTPQMMINLRAIGDHAMVDILKILLRDEIGHVAVGTRWFNHLCKERGLLPFEEFKKQLNAYYIGTLRGPFNLQARKEAGFSQDELTWLESLQGEDPRVARESVGGA